MIAVIADDFTGAAELAGIGLRYNLKVELSVGGTVNTAADLLVVNSDSRSMNEADAEKITADSVTGVLLLKPELLYKKVDSVLRGHVLKELKVQMQQSRLKKALVVSANPSLGRTIRDGLYFINGKPVNETAFLTDPEFAITSAYVTDMVKDAHNEVKLARHTDPLPAEGILIGEAVTNEDMAAWAAKIDTTWALAGAGDFFAALLKKRYRYRVQSETALSMPHLYISGTAFESSAGFIKEAAAKRNCVVYMTESMMKNGVVDEEWLNKLAGVLQSQNRAIIAIDDTVEKAVKASPLSLRTTMASAVKKIMAKQNVQELFIEGGSTASIVLKELGLNKLFPTNEIDRGVVRMQAGDIYVTVKPGSYALPKQIVELYN
jgi:D-threonate/D-erythronate kinase